MTVDRMLTVIEAPRLAERTSIRLGGPAVAEIRASCPAALEQAPAAAEKLGGRMAVLGGGSNIVAHDGELPLVLLTLDGRTPVETAGEAGGKILVRAGGGVPLPVLLARAAALGLSGLEGLSGIPGTVGGALAMNAGSFGVETGEKVHAATLFAPEFGLVERAGADFEFGYRSTGLRGHGGWFVAAEVVFALERSDKEAVRARMREVMAKKSASQPVTERTAGSTFANPAPGVAAGRLLDEAGFRGRKNGGMCFSEKHANFLVNDGTGTFAQAVELMEEAREAVLRRSGHRLELEVRLWP